MKYLSLLLVTTFFISCGSTNSIEHNPSFAGTIADNTSWYTTQSQTVVDINISLPPAPNSSLCAYYKDTLGPIRPCTLEDVNNDTNPFDTYKPAVSALFSTTTFVPINELTNGLLTQKGKSTRSADQKSYKLKLTSKTNLYEGQRRLQYNKQFFDMTRIRNKLSFDLFQDIPDLPSLKTEFVHMTLDGVDKGLFTKIESYDKEYLLHRNWGKDDNLYKAQNFTFYKHPDLVLTDKGIPSNLSAFSAIIEPQRGKEQTKLIEMLDAVNSNVNIDTVISKYFNRENYLTWLAVNILMGNVDTITQNFFLLNPVNSDTFYFLPWDYDDGWGWKNQQSRTGFYARWHLSIARWWDSPLHRKFLTIKKNRDDLDSKILEIRATYITDAKIKTKIDKYKLLVRPYLFTPPDQTFLNYFATAPANTQTEWEQECDRLAGTIQENIQDNDSQKGSPMPFWQVASYSNNLLSLNWDKSIDLEGDTLVYDIQVSNSPDFNTTIVNETTLAVDNILLSNIDGQITYKKTIVGLPSGFYYLKAKASELTDSTHFRYSFDSYYDSTQKKTFHGVLRFEVK